jgi:hypothetical protein
MRLGSSGRYDADDVASNGVGHKQHSAIDQADGIEAGLAGSIEVIEFERKRVKKHLCGRLEIDAMLPAVCLLFGVIPIEIHSLSTDFQ